MMRQLAVARVVGGTLLALAVAPWATAAPAAAGGSGRGPADGHTISICHRTSSDVTPYVVITVDTDAAGGGKDQGAGDHAAEHQGPVWSAGLKSQHVEWGDIIPPYTDDHGVSFPGYNWSAQGQAIYAHGCRPVPSTSSAPVSTSTSAAPSTSKPTKTHTTRPTKTHTAKPSHTSTTTTSSAPATTTSSVPATTTSSVPATTTSSVPATTTSSVPATTTSSAPATSQPVAATSTSVAPTSSSVAVSSTTEVAVLPTKVGTTTAAAAPLAPTGGRLPRWALLTFSATLLLAGGTLVLLPGWRAAERARRH